MLTYNAEAYEKELNPMIDWMYGSLLYHSSTNFKRVLDQAYASKP